MSDAVNPQAGTEEAAVAYIQAQQTKAAPQSADPKPSDRENDNASADETHDDQGSEADTDEADDQGNPADDDGYDDADDADNEADEPQYFTVKRDGKEEKVTLDELRSGYMKDADYRRKTADLARDREATDARAKEVNDLSEKRHNLVKELEAVSSIIEDSLLSEADLNKILAENPTEYIRAKAINDQRREKLTAIRTRSDAITAEQEAANKAEFEKTVTAEKEKLRQAMPSLLKPETQQAFGDYVRAQGYSDDEISNTVDHRLLVAFEKARLYDDMQAKAKQKPNHEVPKVAKGNAQRQSTREAQSSTVDVARKQAFRAPSIDNAAAYLLAKSRQR